MLSRSECFKVLGLDESAGPNAIKRAYRKLAFELHPDLNPDVPEASKRFQDLNEAYVTLMQEYANTSFAAGGKRNAGGSAPGGSAYGGASGGTSGGPADEKAREDARKAYARASQSFNSGASASGNASGNASGGAGSAGSTASGNADEAGAQGGATGTGWSAGATGSGGASSGGSASSGTFTGSFGGSATPPGGRTPGQQSGKEEILRDLLNDPFARRVFEDIYSTVRYKSGKGAKTDGTPPRPVKRSARVKATPRRSTLSKAGDKVLGLAGGLTGGIKGWLRKQIDEDQTMFLPGESLVPGARVRLQVQHGFSGDKRTIEFTLPPEFAPGKPIRLKGLGRRIGGMQGDLYLRVFSSDE